MKKKQYLYLLSFVSKMYFFNTHRFSNCRIFNFLSRSYHVPLNTRIQNWQEVEEKRAKFKTVFRIRIIELTEDIYIFFFISSESQWLMDESEALSAYDDWLLWWKHSWNFLELLCLSQFVLRKKRDNFNHFCF